MTIWNLLFYVDLETSSKMKLVCDPTHSRSSQSVKPYSVRAGWFNVLCRLRDFNLWNHLQIHICVLPFEGPLHLQFQSHICLTFGEGGSTALWLYLCLTLADWGWSTLYLDPSPDSYSCSTFWGSIPSLVPVPYMSQLRWRGINSMSGSTSVQPELLGGSTLSPDPSLAPPLSNLS